MASPRCLRRWGEEPGPRASSRNLTPTPSVPPTSRSEAGIHSLSLNISLNKASRTQMTLPSWASPVAARSMKSL